LFAAILIGVVALHNLCTVRILIDVAVPRGVCATRRNEPNRKPKSFLACLRLYYTYIYVGHTSMIHANYRN